jgi:hypothetical protein
MEGDGYQDDEEFLEMMEQEAAAQLGQNQQ